MTSSSCTLGKSLHAAGFVARSITRSGILVRSIGGRLAWPAACPRDFGCSSASRRCRSRCSRCSRSLERPRRRAWAARSSARRTRSPGARAASACCPSDVAGYTTPDQRAPGRDHHAADQPDPPPGRPRRQARRARAHPGGPAARAAAPRPAARAAGGGPHRARRPAGRALQGRPARPRDRRARVRRLRRPARAHGVHAARLQPGRAHHRHRPPREGGRHRHRQAARQAREAAPRSSRSRSRTRSTRWSRSRASSSTGAARYADARSEKATALASTRDDRHALEGDLRELEAAQARITLGAAGAVGRRRQRAGRPDPGRLRRADLARQRLDRVPVRHALGPPARRRGHRSAGGDADPRGEGRQRRARGLDRRLRQLHLHRPRRRALHLLRAPSRATRPRAARA